MSEKLSSEDVAYVRREKQADDEIQKKLTELYGKGKARKDDIGLLRRGWACASCGYVNFECRLVCGECLDASPAAKAAAGSTQNMKRVAVTSERDVRILQIGDRCYRSFVALGGSCWGSKPKPCGADASGDDRRGAPSLERREGQDDDDHPCDEDEDDDDGVRFDAQLETFEAVVTISRRYFKFIIGSGGQTLHETQRLTGATIILPQEAAGTAVSSAAAAAAGTASASLESDDSAQVKVRGPTANSVRGAMIRLDAIIARSRDKVDYTHFLMIPLGKVASLARECQSLINDMVSACCSEEFCIDESIFVSPGRLHFTLLMLRLHTTQEVERAKATLCAMEKDVAKIFAGAGGSTFHFGGLHYMNDDPTQVHVLYLGMQPKGTAGASAVSGNGTETVQALVQLLNDRFTREGFALESDVARNSKIHATIMNTKWRRSAASSSNDNVPLSAPVADNARVAFNATNVLHLFGGASLGVHRMDRVELCALRGSASSGGFYPCEAFIPIP